jgi:hypothetical protein
MPLESVADTMGTSDKSLDDPTIQEFLEILEDIPSTANQDQVTAEILNWTSGNGDSNYVTSIQTSSSVQRKVPGVDEKLKKNQNLSSAMEAASILLAEKTLTSMLGTK